MMERREGRATIYRRSAPACRPVCGYRVSVCVERRTCMRGERGEHLRCSSLAV